MLQRDNQLRLSDEYQSLYKQTLHPNESLPIIFEIQDQVVLDALIHFGQPLTDDLRISSLSALRSARSLFPDDPDIRNAAHYMKFNRMFDSSTELMEGDEIDLISFNLIPISINPSFNVSDNEYWLFMTGSLS